MSTSLSARRAWIEMLKIGLMLVLSLVALRKESVDRNLNTMQIIIVVVESLSARRAWIEIPCAAILSALVCLSLSARRAWIEINSGETA